ncbi:MAG TPA: peptidoglycan-associated lipoprotein Pal [Desulfobacteraceae bacterium]|nr:peptidoglycan-associated lipoprotein Pal [Desulfobacteraceae bacterium]
MKRNLWMNLLMAVLVAGLFMTVSCAQKKVVSESTTIEDQAAAEAAAAEKAAAEAERIKQQEIEEKMAREKAAKIAAAKNRFENQNIHFEFDSAELNAMAKMLLKEKAEWLNANPMAKVTIEGHCDERGTTDYNLALGERRARAAKNYLVDLGVSAARLTMISFGEEKPLDPGMTEEAYRKNRRAQFVIK